MSAADHDHVGPEDEVCPGCLGDAPSDILRDQRRKTIWGLALLIGLVVLGMGLLSWYLNDHGPHIR